MIRTYKNEETRAIAEEGGITKQMLRILPKHLHMKARIRLAALDACIRLESLAVYPGLDLKKISDFYQMRINDTYRIRFFWDGKDSFNVEIGDFHK
jgi:plasmid maintenance system killer protein